MQQHIRRFSTAPIFLSQIFFFLRSTHSTNTQVLLTYFWILHLGVILPLFFDALSERKAIIIIRNERKCPHSLATEVLKKKSFSPPPQTMCCCKTGKRNHKNYKLRKWIVPCQIKKPRFSQFSLFLGQMQSNSKYSKYINISSLIDFAIQNVFQFVVSVYVGYVCPCVCMCAEYEFI